MISRDTIEKRIAKITAAFHERVHMFTLETQRHESAVAELERLLPLFDSVQDLAGTQPPTRPAEPLSDVILRILQDARQPLTFDEIDAGLVCEGHVTTNARLASIIGFMECASLSKVRALRDGDPALRCTQCRPCLRSGRCCAERMSEDLMLAWSVRQAFVEPVLIGMEAPLSGAQRNNGLDMWRGAKLAAEQLNDEGGILGRPVKLLRADDQADPARALPVARRLKRRGADAVIGKSQRIYFRAGFFDSDDKGKSEQPAFEMSSLTLDNGIELYGTHEQGESGIEYRITRLEALTKPKCN